MCSERLGNWWLYFGSEARIQIGRCVCLVGLAADVESAEPVRFAELERSYALGGLDGLLDYTDRLVGRFLVLVEDDGGLSVVPDGWGSLQAFWANSRSGPSAVSSSPGLLRDLGFGALAQCDRARSRNEAQAKALEYRSVGDLCPISGTRRVRSNHVLELSVGRAARLPLRHRRATFEEVTAELGRAIRGLQLAHGGESWLPITAGLDSRWLAVAASVAGAEPLLFTFTPDHEPTPDATIGAEIADRLGAEHANIALPERVSQSVRDDVTAVRGAWRDLPKMAEIEYLSSLGKRILVLNGNGGEIVRGGYYGTGPRPISRRLVRSLCLGPHPSTFDRDGFDRWFASLASLPAERRVDLDELFYWEQRMSNWGSDFYAEKDNYVDELSPFCCRRILRTGPALAGRRHRIRVAEALASQPLLQGVPINPHERSGALREYAYVKAIANVGRDFVPSGARPAVSGGDQPELPPHTDTSRPQPIEHSSIRT